jgi:hypothetical protein
VATSGSGNAPGPSPAGSVPAAGATSERAAAPADSSGDDFERLRELLLGGERRELSAARARIAELERAQHDLPRRLPGAAVEALRTGKDNARVASALSEPVAQALGTAVQNNRQSIVDALFPIIGPMIRKAIAEALRGLVDNLNGAIESSFSLRGLQWRVEAWRGGVPYAQVVLKHRLSYAIDHVFLIERGSGLVLHHASAPGLPALDADAIAGMLTALGDFVDDSVGDDSGGALDSAQVGEYLVWVEHGPRANLACFMRGVAPVELRALLEQRIEEIHSRILALPADAPLRAIGEDARVSDLLDPQRLLRDAGSTAAPVAAGKTSHAPIVVIVLLALALLGWYAIDRWRWSTRVEALRTRLLAQPGFVLGGVESKPWKSLVVRGLLDPDAPPLAPLLAAVDLGKATSRLDTSGYISTDDAMIARRATRLLEPPSTVTLAVHAGVITFDGRAPAEWIDGVAARAHWIPGVARVESALAPDIDAVATARSELVRVLANLGEVAVPFVQDADPGPEAARAVDHIATLLKRAMALARVARKRVSIDAFGSNDASGGEQTNARLRLQRAQWLALALAARGIDEVRAVDAPDGAPDRRAAHVRAAVVEEAR